LKNHCIVVVLVLAFFGILERQTTGTGFLAGVRFFWHSGSTNCRAFRDILVWWCCCDKLNFANFCVKKEKLGCAVGFWPKKTSYGNVEKIGLLFTLLEASKTNLFLRFFLKRRD
jgi:hypothetical protein